MHIQLGNRTAETVSIYFQKANKPEIRAVLPQKARTEKEALADYQKTLLPTADSYGKIIIADGNYIGDIWCYCMNMHAEPNAMLSFCIFEPAYWAKGIATKAVSLFLEEVREKYALDTIGAFTFAENAGSMRVLEKNGFVVSKEFSEAGRKSNYLLYAYG